MVPVLCERPCYRLVVVAWAALLARLEALAAINRLAWAWVERNFGVLTALRASCRVQGSLTTVATVVSAAAAAAVVSAAAATAVAIAAGAVSAAAAAAVAIATALATALCLALLSAAWASLRIGESTGRVKILLTGRKGELVATIAAGKRSIAHYSLNLSRPSQF